MNDQIFKQIKDEMYYWDIDSVAEATGLHKNTLFAWMNGTIKSPRNHNLIAVAGVLGFEVCLRKQPQLWVVK